MANASPNRSRRRAAPRGQALVEYSILNWVLIVALILSTQVSLIPTPSGNKNVIEMMMMAFQNYLDSYYFVLSIPFP